MESPGDARLVVDGLGRLIAFHRVPDLSWDPSEATQDEDAGESDADAPEHGTASGGAGASNRDGDDATGWSVRVGAGNAGSSIVQRSSGAGAVESEKLLSFAGLDPSQLEPIPVKGWRPPVYADRLEAWSGRYGDTPLEIRAASLEGAPVWFSVERSEPAEVKDPRQLRGWRGLAFLIIFITVLVVLVVLVRNAISTLSDLGGPSTF